MVPTVEIVLVRHAQPEWIRDGLNVVDPPLTEVGRQQAVVLDAIMKPRRDEPDIGEAHDLGPQMIRRRDGRCRIEEGRKGPADPVARLGKLMRRKRHASFSSTASASEISENASR